MIATDLLQLAGEISQHLAAFEKNEALYRAYAPVFFDSKKRDLRDAVLLSEILCNSYTCLETVFFRIARAFENHLEAPEWHRELLNKMRIEIPGVRKAVLSVESYGWLDELRRFRHFKRCYYEFDYNWEKLGFLQSVYEKLCPAVKRELLAYREFVELLAAGCGREAE